MMNWVVVCGGKWILWCFCQCGMIMLVLWVFESLAAMVDDDGFAYAPLFIHVSGCLGA